MKTIEELGNDYLKENESKPTEYIYKYIYQDYLRMINHLHKGGLSKEDAKTKAKGIKFYVLYKTKEKEFILNNNKTGIK